MEHTGLQSPPPDNAQLVRFFSGESTLSENLQMQQWEREDPRHSQWITEARKIWDLTVSIDSPWNVDGMRSRVLTAMASLESGTVGSMAPVNLDSGALAPSVSPAEEISPATSSISRARSYFSYFAIAGLVLATGLLIKTKSNVEQTIYQESTYTTPRGQHANVTLPDGSTVHLSVGSRLKVPVDFAMNNRVLHLEGEAFFTVNHNSDKPFAVVAGSSITRVLGTRFAVRQYDTDSVAIVAVQDGKVSVQRLDNKGAAVSDWTAVLSAQEQVSVGSSSVSAVSSITGARFDFKQNRLVVDGDKLSSVIPDLERWFDVKIQLGDAHIGDRRLLIESTGTSIEELQMILEQSLSLGVVRKGRVITVYTK